jgi:hypothetical protein
MKSSLKTYHQYNHYTTPLYIGGWSGVKVMANDNIHIPLHQVKLLIINEETGYYSTWCYCWRNAIRKFIEFDYEITCYV